MREPTDERVNAYVLSLFREDRPPDDHLTSCPDAHAVDSDMFNGTYGCETGCEYARLEAVVTCPHGFKEDFEYGMFGEVSDLIDDMVEWERSP